MAFSLNSSLALAIELAQAIASVEAGQTASVNIPAESFAIDAGPLGKLDISTPVFAVSVKKV